MSFCVIQSVNKTAVPRRVRRPIMICDPLIMAAICGANQQRFSALRRVSGIIIEQRVIEIKAEPRDQLRCAFLMIVRFQRVRQSRRRIAHVPQPLTLSSPQSHIRVASKTGKSKLTPSSNGALEALSHEAVPCDDPDWLQDRHSFTHKCKNTHYRRLLFPFSL